jgi:hypothetical protein
MEGNCPELNNLCKCCVPSRDLNSSSYALTGCLSQDQPVNMLD